MRFFEKNVPDGLKSRFDRLTLDLVALILLVFLLLKKVLSASSYGHFTAAKEFRSQCHIFRFWNNQSRRVTIIHGFNAVEFACGPGKRAQK